MLLLLTLFWAILLSCPAFQGMASVTKNYLAPLNDIGGSDKIPDRYVVMLNRGYDIGEHWRAIGADLSSSPGFGHWQHLSGYTAKLSTRTLNRVRQDTNVLFVETDRHVNLDLHTMPTDLHAADFELDGADVEDVGEGGCNEPTQSNRRWKTITQDKPPWNLGVISAGGKLTSFSQGLNPKESQAKEYEFLLGAGSGVNVYVLDTGINTWHHSFAGDAENFDDLALFGPSPYMVPTQPVFDTADHGTAVASVVGADGVGVARGANMINVKLISGRDNVTGIVSRFGKAFNDVALAHVENCQTHSIFDAKFRGSIISAAFGHSPELPKLGDKQIPGKIDARSFLERIVEEVRSVGIEVIASAGNEGKDYDNQYTWPCNAPGVICVGSINSSYQVPKYSNIRASPTNFYLAPGDLIKSASFAGDNVMNLFNGTSIATPMVVGVAATFMSYLGLAGGGPGGVDKYLKLNALMNLCSRPDGGFLGPAQNRLVTTGIHHPNKRANEPFVGAGSAPAIYRQKCPNVPKRAGSRKRH